MNSKKILVVPFEFLDRWKPDLSNYNVNKEQRLAINETAIGYLLDQLKIRFKNYKEPGYSLPIDDNKSTHNIIFNKL